MSGTKAIRECWPPIIFLVTHRAEEMSPGTRSLEAVNVRGRICERGGIQASDIACADDGTGSYCQPSSPKTLSGAVRATFLNTESWNFSLSRTLKRSQLCSSLCSLSNSWEEFERPTLKK